jgi:ABC-type branched-subunit amino acid transport system ATPase component
MSPHVVLLIGPAGVGKTTVARHLRDLRPASIAIAGDDLRAFSPDGAADRGAGGRRRG